MSSELEKVSSEFSASQVQLSKVQSSLQSIEEEKRDLLSDQSHLRSQVSSLQSQIEDLRNEKQKFDLDVSRLQDQNLQIESERQILLSDRSRFDNEISVLQSQINESSRPVTERNLCEVVQELENEKCRLLTRLNEMQQLQAQQQSTQLQNSSVLEAIRHEKNLVESQVQTLTKELSESKDERHGLETALLHAQNQITSDKSQISSLESLVKSLQTEKAEMSQNHSRLFSELSACQSLVDSLQEEKERLETRALSLENELVRVQTQFESDQKTCASQRAALERAIQELQGQFETAAAENSQLKDLVDCLKQKSDSIAEQSSLLQEYLNIERQEKQKQATEFDNAKSCFAHEIQELKLENDRLTRQVANLSQSSSRYSVHAPPDVPSNPFPSSPDPAPSVALSDPVDDLLGLFVSQASVAQDHPQLLIRNVQTFMEQAPMFWDAFQQASCEDLGYYVDVSDFFLERLESIQRILNSITQNRSASLAPDDLQRQGFDKFLQTLQQSTGLLPERVSETLLDSLKLFFLCGFHQFLANSNPNPVDSYSFDKESSARGCVFPGLKKGRDFVLYPKST